MRHRCLNPFSFSPTAVTMVVTLVYAAVLTVLILLHTNVPAPPINPIVYRGLNLTEAWLDLDELSNGYHPFNSRRNDEVRNWLLIRLTEILDGNKVTYHISDGGHSVPKAPDSHIGHNTSSQTSFGPSANHNELQTRNSQPAVVIFNDLVSNYTSTALTSIGVTGRRAGISTYFEGNNIIVYIRGTEDEDNEWWLPPPPHTRRVHGKGGVMVNAHFDSVSTGYGATDDGVGVVTALQIVKYFTTTGNAPQRGVVALFNNGEEDGLYGAKAFLSHPMSSFVHAFLNLEGAGAGGRAMLFRSTDTEVTRAYRRAPHPMGSVVSADGFSLGIVRSETDYVVFRGEGYRGLDVAFWEPRARYHTDQDDARHTSRASLWHMLSASVETMQYLSKDISEFVGPRGDGDKSKVNNGRGTDGVWFDVFGIYMAVFRLRSMFAWSLVLLIASPLILIFITYLLIRLDRYYLFSSGVRSYHNAASDAYGRDVELISIQGWHGAFRFPVTLTLSAALTFGAAFLLKRINPFIVYSAQYSVWAMSMSLFFCTFWVLMASFNHVRPTALQRVYSLIWMFSLGWLLLVAATVFEDRFKISGGYMFVIFQATVFLATLIGLCELFALPRKQHVVEEIFQEHGVVSGNLEGVAITPHVDAIIRRTGTNRTLVRLPYDGTQDAPGIDEDENETTPLVGSSSAARSLMRTAFSKGFSNAYKKHRIAQNDGPHDGSGIDGTDGAAASHVHDDDDGDMHHHHHHDRPYGDCQPFGHEQNWSYRLPRWSWVLQFLVVCPISLVVFGQVGLLLVTALAQTGTDGSPLLLPYLAVALFSVLLLVPIGPFMHRVRYHIPAVLFIIFLATLAYNLLAFPFSEDSRYKAYFQQTVDLNTGVNHVTLAGIEKYIREIISQIPSASGQQIRCVQRPDIRSGLDFCSWEGLAPHVVKSVPDGVPPQKGYKDWLSFNVTRAPGGNEATFQISGHETKACIIRFDEPFTAFNVQGADPGDGRWANVPESGSDQIKLWHRDWDKEWVVDVAWPVSHGKQVGEEGRSGRVVCLWSDHNESGTIPALDEAQRFAPKWASITKVMDGLVEGSKPFII